MIQQSLNGAWSLFIPGTTFGTVPAQVPGSVYHDLLCAGKIPDPFYRDNENEALKLMEHEFRYSRVFTAEPSLLESDAVLLRCEGLDTLAEVFVNGQSAGRADNMHRIWEFDVKALLHEGENEIAVHFASPTKFIREAYAQSPADGSSDAMTGFPLLRKAHCMFGWDWGPRLPDAGIWRDISLLGIRTARIRDVLVLQEHEENGVTLRVQTHLNSISPEKTEVSVTITGPDGRIFTGCNVENASFGLSNCAERTALFKAVSEGAREFGALAIAAKTKAWPCGACRQVLNEFAPNLHVMVTWDDHVEEKNLRELLPEGFGPDSM